MSDDLVCVPMLVRRLGCLVLRRLLTPMVETPGDTKLIRTVLKLTGFSSLSRSLKDIGATTGGRINYLTNDRIRGGYPSCDWQLAEHSRGTVKTAPERQGDRHG